MSSLAASPGARPRGPASHWGVLFGTGLLTLVVGLVALAFPGPTLLAVGLLFGGYLVVWGVMALMSAAGAEGAPHFLRFLQTIAGLLAGSAGLVLIVRPGQSVLTAAWVLGFWWVLQGFLQIARGAAVAGPGRIGNLLWGLLGVIAGTIILSSPNIGVATLVLIVAIALLVQGSIEMWLALQLRREARA